MDSRSQPDSVTHRLPTAAKLQGVVKLAVVVDNKWLTTKEFAQTFLRRKRSKIGDAKLAVKMHLIDQSGRNRIPAVFAVQFAVLCSFFAAIGCRITFEIKCLFFITKS